MSTLRENIQLGVFDQRVCSWSPRDRDVPIFCSMKNQRWDRKCMKLVNEVGVKATPSDLVPLPESPSLPHSWLLRYLINLIHEASCYSLGIVKYGLQAPPYHPATPT